MKKLTQFSKDWLASVLISVVGFLLAFLLYQNAATDKAQADDIKDNRNYTVESLKEHCETQDRAMDKKVDNKHFDTVLTIILEQQKEDKEFRKETVKTLQKVQTKLEVIEERVK